MRKRLRTAKGLSFNTRRVSNLRYRYGIAGIGRATKLQGDDVYTVEQAAQVLGVSRDTVIRWIESGLLHAAQLSPAPRGGCR